MLLPHCWPMTRSPSPAARGAEPATPSGVCFPLVAATGKRSTTPTAKAILSAAIGVADGAAARALLHEKDSAWRFGYTSHFVAHAELLASSAASCVAMARGGLAETHRLFEFGRDGRTLPLSVAMDGATFPGTFETGVIEGVGAPGGELTVPYLGRDYAGAELLALLRDQAEKGTCDSSVGDAIARLQQQPQWLDLSDKPFVFVLIGATSEMGPLRFLLEHGAHVVAIARPSGKWAGLLETARQSAGTLTYPMADGSEGADAMESTPELANWLASLYPTKQLVICSYIYQGACLSSHPVGLF